MRDAEVRKSTSIIVLIVGALLAGACSPEYSETASKEPSEVMEIDVDPNVEQPPLTPSTIRYDLNQDSDFNQADNRVIGGPDAFAFYDVDELKGGDLFGSGAQAESRVQIFTASGPVSIGFSPKGGEKDTIDYSVTIQQEPDASLLAATAARVRLPAQGLTPEEYQLQVNVFDKDGSVESTASIDAVENSHIQAVGLYGDKLVIRSSTGEYVSEANAWLETLSAYDALTGNVLWSKDLVEKSSSDSRELGVLSSTTLDRSPDGYVLYGTSDGLTAVDPQTGLEKWVRPAPRVYSGRPEPGGSFPIRIVEYNGASAHDFRDGSTLAPDGVSFAIDHEQDLLAVSYVDRGPMSASVEVVGNGPAFEVIDLNNNRTVYELPADEGLKHTTLNVLAAFDGLIWVQSGPDISVIQASNGQLSPESESLSQISGGLPRYRGDKWLVLGDRDNPHTFLWNAEGKFSLEDLTS